MALCFSLVFLMKCVDQTNSPELKQAMVLMNLDLNPLIHITPTSGSFILSLLFGILKMGATISV